MQIDEKKLNSLSNSLFFGILLEYIENVENKQLCLCLSDSLTKKKHAKGLSQPKIYQKKLWFAAGTSSYAQFQSTTYILFYKS